nr:SpoIID/LytB domain-containing protein [Fervidicella metallireducens]
MGRHRSSGYDVCDGTHCQVYRGYNEGYDKVIKAVEETRGVILVYGNSLVNTYYSASNGGYTESSENAWGGRVDYLKSFKDDIDNDSWPYGDRKLTKSEIDMILKSKGYLSLNQSLTDIKISGTFTSGRVKEITIKYIDVDNVEKEKKFSVNDNVRSFFAVTSKNQDIKTKYPEFFNLFNNSVLFSANFPLLAGKQVNTELKDVYTGFPSALFTFTYDDKTSTYTFSGKGYGHGIGMSQKGAKYRAERGASFEDILKFYYVGTSLKQLNTYVKTFSLTNSYALVGDSIGTNISIVGDSNRLLYKYIVEKSGEKVFTGEYTNSSAFSFSPTSTGEYSINLYVKDIASNREYDDLKTSKLSVYIPPKINKVTVNQESQYAGKAVVINTGVSGGSSKGIDYKYEVILNDKVLYTTGYISNSQFTYTPAFEGDYTVNVYIKDRANNKDFDDFNSASFSAKIFVDTSRGGTSGSYINKKLVLKRTLKKGLTGEDVKYLQQALLDLGYNIGTSKPTGLFGNGTHNAVVSFQKKNKLPSYGIVASATVDAINKSLSAKYKAPQSPSRGQLLAALRLTYKRTLISGSKGEDVKKLQNALKFLKYSVDVTGVYDKKTYNAVMTFQKKYKIMATGKLDLTTVNKINSLLK